MPVPFILGGLAVAAAGYGVKKGIDAKDKIDRTENIQIQIKDLINRCNILMKSSKENSTNAIQKLGQTKISVMSTSMNEFVDIYSKMKNVNFTDIGIDELKNFKPENKEIAELQVASVGAIDLTVSSAGAIAGSTLLAAGTYGAVMHGGFALASTGTAIGTLHGAAATNATLAWLGGGSLATGGFGMAGGMAVLGGIVAGPALALGGVFLDSKAEDKLYEALEQKDKAIRFQKEVEQAVLALKAIAKRSIQVKDLLANLNVLFDSQITKFKTIVELLGYNYAEYPEKAKHTVAINAMLAKIIKIIIDTPLLTTKGELTTDSFKVISRFETITEKTCDNKDSLVTYLGSSNRNSSAEKFKSPTQFVNLTDKILTLVIRKDAKGLFDLGCELEDNDIENAKRCYKEASDLGSMSAYNRLRYLNSKGL